MGKERMDATPGGGRILTYRRPTALRLGAVVFALVMGLALALGAMLSGAQQA